MTWVTDDNRGRYMANGVATASNGQVHVNESCPDIVATQGSFLIPLAHTPVYERRDHTTFAVDLCMRLAGLRIRHGRRWMKYGIEAADEWPISRTPPEVIQNRKDEPESMEALRRDFIRDAIADADLRLAPVASVRPDWSAQATCLPSLPSTMDDTVAQVSRKRKRRHGSEADKELEKEQPIKAHITTAYNTTWIRQRRRLNTG